MQSNYLPWRGYFDLMSRCDEFVIYDSCQYTVNDWRNRNRIKTANGAVWITVPVLTKGRTGQTIREAEVVDHGWVRKHRASIAAAVGRAPFGDWLIEVLSEPFDRALETRFLHEINLDLLRACHDALGLGCDITDDRDHLGDNDDLSASERVAELVAAAGGTHYLTGPSGLAYLDTADFSSRDVALEVLDYSTLGPYPQLFGEFDNALSVVDLLANVGPDATEHLSARVEAVTDPTSGPVITARPTGST